MSSLALARQRWLLLLRTGFALLFGALVLMNPAIALMSLVLTLVLFGLARAMSALATAVTRRKDWRPGGDGSVESI
jgi:uncharacterized membrane protein HdeD (DUF308 family)